MYARNKRRVERVKTLDVLPALRHRQPHLASRRSFAQRLPPADTIAAYPHAHKYRSRQLPRQPPFHLPAFPVLPSLLHPIPQSLHATCPRPLPALDRPATAPPWNPPAATIPLVGCVSSARSVAAGL